MSPSESVARPAAAGRAVAGYFPAVIVALFDSPLDALISLTVPRDEALDLVVASWPAQPRRVAGSSPVAAAGGEGGQGDGEAAGGEAAPAIIAHIQGGRCVAVLPTTAGRWAACNAFLDPPCHTYAEAERFLARLLRARRVGCIGRLPPAG